MMKLSNLSSQDQKSGEITFALQRWSSGDEEALGDVMGQVYEDLKASARYYLSGENGSHTLQPTALLNETYLRLRTGKQGHFPDRAHFLAYAAHMMRHILVDYARARHAGKRGSGQDHASLGQVAELALGSNLEPATILALNDALNRLEQKDTRACRVVELRFFAGLTNEEVMEILNLSRSTVKREWRTARRWLSRELRSC